jgi:hypothetical protein
VNGRSANLSRKPVFASSGLAKESAIDVEIHYDLANCGAKRNGDDANGISNCDSFSGRGLDGAGRAREPNKIVLVELLSRLRGELPEPR